MKIFLLEGYKIVKIPMSAIGVPIKAGIHDVRELELVRIDTTNAQMIK